MRRRLKFEKEVSGWYVDLPEWTGEKADLQMVCGADLWLDILCQGEWDIWVTISDEPFENAEELILTDGPDMESGSWYEAKTYIGIEYNLQMWLCDVTKFVFGHFPRTIYYKS